MSLIAPPELPPVPTAPHYRVHHIFYTAPYIVNVFEDFLAAHPECDILETDVMVNALSAVYIQGVKHSEDFWKVSSVHDLNTTREEMVSRLQRLRMVRGKYQGRHQWDHFLAFLYELTGEQLPSRKSRKPLVNDEPESMVRFALAILALKLYTAPPPKPVVERRPKRPAGRLLRQKKSEP